MLLDDVAPKSVAEAVARDSYCSPTWRKYKLNLQVSKMMLAKDRGLPMAEDDSTCLSERILVNINDLLITQDR